jgi:hypothetical protein
MKTNPILERLSRAAAELQHAYMLAKEADDHQLAHAIRNASVVTSSAISRTIAPSEMPTEALS